MGTRRFSESVHDFQEGDVVALTGKFLKSTGQQVGGEGRKQWKVVGTSGDFVIVNEPADTAWYTAAELAADPSLKWRRINSANLYRVGTLTSRNDP